MDRLDKAKALGVTRAAIFVPRTWQERQGSNPRPSVLETDALPAELRSCGAAARAGPWGDAPGVGLGADERACRVEAALRKF